MDLKTKVKQIGENIDKNLEQYLPPEDQFPQTIYKAMKYSVFAGGKRLRPVLAVLSCEAVEGDVDKVIPFACAIEMIHTYSLIHDDLPAMDNDDYRRGKLTNHKVFGDAMAILAGDALLNTATEIMLKSAMDNNDSNHLKAMNEILTASGTKGMISGQVVDIESEGKGADEATLNFIHKHKTGALIRASVRAGAIIGGSNEKQLEKITEFSENLGLAFQIRDDVLDIIGDQESLGKEINSDIDNEKLTFPSVYGLEKSKQMVSEVSQNAIDALDIFNEKGQLLKDLTYYLVTRES